MELKGLKYYLHGNLYKINSGTTPSGSIGRMAVYTYRGHRYALRNTQGRDDVFIPTGEYIYYTEYFTIPSGSRGVITMPNIGMDITTHTTMRVDEVDFVVDGFSADHLTSTPGEIRSFIGDNGSTGEPVPYVVISSSPQYLQLIPFDIIYVDKDIEIDEPTGFDSISLSMKRSDYHGMSALFSDVELGFYGDAIQIIKNAYSDNIDAEVPFIVKNLGGEVILTAVLDLTTFTDNVGEYSMVSCKVCEVGTKTIFNNRTNVSVDLCSTKTIEGLEINDVPKWKSLRIPPKHLSYTNFLEQTEDLQLTESDGAPHSYSGIYFSTNAAVDDHESVQYFTFAFNKERQIKFGRITQIEDQHKCRTVKDLSELGTSYYPDEEHSEKYGQDTKVDIDFRLIATFVPKLAHGQIGFSLGATDGQNTIETDVIYFTEEMHDGIYTPMEIDLHLTGRLNANRNIRYYLRARYNMDNRYGYFTAVIHSSSYFRMMMYDTLTYNVAPSDMLPIHDALNTIVEAISDNALTVKSDYYAHKGSVVNPSGNTPGLGALKAITNGYKMRGIFQDENGERRNMPLSFKDAIESLNAIDCIGWGFSKENGQLYVRVERWDWFYDDNTVLFSITGVRTITRRMAADDVITTLSIGYKKYATNEDYNSIDSIHGERDFLSGIKAVANEKSVKSEFIADNYAIEETRRARENVDPSEEFKYNENIFIFELVDIRDEQFGDENLAILSTLADVTNATGIARPTELINAKLSPRHCAARWRDFLFSANNRSNMKFGSGTINYNASFDVIPRYQSPQQSVSGKHVWSLQPYCEDEEYLQQSEKDDITYNHAKFKAEELEFEYPISTDQYNAILANPYGLIEVEGEPCWIRSFKYKLITGMAHFVLIPKYVEE